VPEEQQIATSAPLENIHTSDNQLSNPTDDSVASSSTIKPLDVNFESTDDVADGSKEADKLELGNCSSHCDSPYAGWLMIKINLNTNLNVIQSVEKIISI